MTYTISTSTTVRNDDGEDIASFEREYTIGSLDKIPAVFDHAGRTCVLLTEGAETFQVDAN